MPKLIIADYDAAKAAEFKDQFPEVAVVDIPRLLRPLLIFLHLAMGGVINTDTINTLM
ncbi:MAG: hypothetical protein R3A45_02040 [Bdellovibrionota bacterium]